MAIEDIRRAIALQHSRHRIDFPHAAERGFQLLWQPVSLVAGRLLRLRVRLFFCSGFLICKHAISRAIALTADAMFYRYCDSFARMKFRTIRTTTRVDRRADVDTALPAGAGKRPAKRQPSSR
ncbi:MAG TPA: hypothetical protein DIT28_00540 [Oxalobacteraceae bacterium]|nr:hypothetical protein [Oxalobacteraceae bacterium]